VLTDNGKQFTGRFTKPRPAEVLFERVCREHGITARLTGPYSPTTTGKVERWHRTLRRELLDVSGPFADLPTAQAAIDGWVHAYNHQRPHQALDMTAPATRFRPGVSPDREPLAAAPRAEREPAAPSGPVPRLVLSPSGEAVEFETAISPAGVLSVLPRAQRLKMGKALAGEVARVWADEVTVHVLIGGKPAKTVPSALDAEDLAELRMRGAAPAGPPPATPAPARAEPLPAGTVIEVSRTVDVNGNADLAGRKVKIGPELARSKVTLRLDGHLLHVIADGVLAKTLPSPVAADDRAGLRGARIADTPLPAPAPGPVSVQRKVPKDGVIMVTRQRLRVGAAYAGKIVTVHVEDTHFRVTCDGADIALHPRNEQRPVTRWRAKIHAPKPETPSSMS
jgi:integrase-like protein/Mu transposase-like protein